MTAPMPETETERVGLSEAERSALWVAMPDDVNGTQERLLYAAAERILSDRHAALLAELAANREALARVEALRDAYYAWDGDPESEFSSSPRQRAQLDAALATRSR